MRTFLLLAAATALGTLPAPVLAQDGKALYEATCVACHGPSGHGAISGVPDLAAPTYLQKSDAELAANVLTGVHKKGALLAMPPKGGNPTLTEADARALVEYIRRITASAK